MVSSWQCFFSCCLPSTTLSDQIYYMKIWRTHSSVYGNAMTYRAVGCGFESGLRQSGIIWSSYRHCSQIWHLCVTYVEWFVDQLWHTTGFQLLWVNRDGCHMWGRKCSLSGTPDFTPFGEFMILPTHYIYTIYYWICQFYDYVYGLMTALSRNYFIHGLKRHHHEHIPTNNLITHSTSLHYQ